MALSFFEYMARLPRLTTALSSAPEAVTCSAKRGLVAELACGVDLDLDLAARALGDVLRELKRGLVVGVRDGRGVGEADRLGGEVSGTGDGARKGGRDGHGGGLDEVGHCVGSRCCLS